MRTPASLRSHPVHPMLIVFPIGLWVFSLVCDIIYHAGSYNPFWKDVAFYSMAGGVVGAVLAAIPGFIDYLSLTDPRIKRIATTHMVLNLIVTALFLFNLGLRYQAAATGDTFPIVLSLVALGLLSASGWLGGSMVYEHHVGVSPSRDQREIERRVA